MQPDGSASTNRTGAKAIWIAGFGHALFAATMIALGMMILVKGDFVVPWSGVPDSMPAHAALAYVCGALLLGSGVGLLSRPAAMAASRVLLGFSVLWMLAFRLPLLVRAPTSSAVWLACGDTAVMLGAAGVLVFGFGANRRGKRGRFPVRGECRTRRAGV